MVFVFVCEYDKKYVMSEYNTVADVHIKMKIFNKNIFKNNILYRETGAK